MHGSTLAAHSVLKRNRSFIMIDRALLCCHYHFVATLQFNVPAYLEFEPHLSEALQLHIGQQR